MENEKMMDRRASQSFAADKARRLLAEYVYGPMPPRPAEIRVKEKRRCEVYGGSGVMTECTLVWDGFTEDVRIVVPAGEKKVPLVLKLDYLCGIGHAFAREEVLVREGRYAFAVVGRKNLAPDSMADVPMFPERIRRYGSVALWAHGASVCLDYLDREYGFLQPGKIAITGHSRDGKAALCAGVYDERFTVICPNGSGVGGASSLREQPEGAEPLRHLVEQFPWFTPHLSDFANCPETLPFDMDLAIAALAPRAFLATEASEDRWANPEGTLRNIEAARAEYRRCGAEDRLAFHIRPGEHNQTEEDVDALIAFCDRMFGNPPSC